MPDSPTTIGIDRDLTMDTAEQGREQTMASNKSSEPGIVPAPFTHQMSTYITAEPNELSDESDEADNMTVSNISNDDAHSIIGVTISHAASRMKSARTPAAEKAAAMDDLAGGYFDSDPETPSPQEPDTPTASDTEAAKPQTGVDKSLPKLPSPKLKDGQKSPPTPWQPGPKSMVIQKGDNGYRSSMQGVFDSGRKRQGSLSNGAEALRKLLPKNLPSIAQVGNLFGASTSSGHKSRASISSPRSATFSSSPTWSSNSKQKAGDAPQGLRPRPHQTTKSSPQNDAPRPSDVSGVPERPRTIRRATSDDSMLYHSLSRASSLGDDSRFENHHDQVNSRVKAIRDSLQDRSTFRMPQMPSMPSMPRVPSFGFSMNFLNSNIASYRSKSVTDMNPGILQATVTKKKALEPSPVIPGSPKVSGGVPSESTSATTEGTVLDRAIQNLTGDVVIMGGYRGSVLRSAKPPHRQLWVPVKVGLNIRKVNLEVGLDPEDEETMEERIFASGMLQNIGPVDISRRLFKKLRESENARNGKLRVWDYGYDWRLSPHLLSRKLQAFLEKLPSNQPGPNGEQPEGALVIAHSLGGLITRHVVNQKPELFSGVIYAGVPQSCVNILGPFRNGDAVLLSSRVLTAQVNFTLRTSFVLLPENGECFFDLYTREKYPVDFFNLDDWIKYRFSPVTDQPLPPIQQSTSGIGSILNLPGSFLNLPMAGKKSSSGTSTPSSPSSAMRNENDERNPANDQSKTSRAADVLRNIEGGTDRTLAPQMGNTINSPTGHTKGHSPSASTSVSTAVTLPRDKAIQYLRRTLAETKKFKQELHFKPELSDSNRYPPLAVIYGKSIPTVYGAKVAGREGIPCQDVYDNLAFASGDGVCLAKEAMLPEGYMLVKGGKIRSDRGHVTLLGDLNAVGRAMEVVRKGRVKGIGRNVGVSGSAVEGVGV
ncbi:phosphatidylcholine-sterol O-acyltransferase protein [Rutstroemia sp. NJR-2017a BVV2]|nr:phosphatidylcholine-sterol O-acyltransferase protein [Rutstroemia sp. NJR-2017a BVV2]